MYQAFLKRMARRTEHDLHNVKFGTHSICSVFFAAISQLSSHEMPASLPLSIHLSLFQSNNMISTLICHCETAEIVGF